MAKDNLFLGTARGSVGDVTFSRLNGVQIARVRNRSPRNPQSPAQMVQRIIMSTVGKAYSFMSELCDHSFEGFEMSQKSQRKFMEFNVGILRDKVADVLAYPVEGSVKASTAFNFSFKNDFAPVLNSMQISAGSLPSLSLLKDEVGTSPTLYFDPGDKTAETLTYGDLISALGCQRGDQLTFIQVTHNGQLTGHDTDLLTGFRFARVILEPGNGDLTAPFLVGGNAINDPNERNEGGFRYVELTNTETAKGLRFFLDSVVGVSDSNYPDRMLAGSAVILSRNVGGRWLRSTQFLMPRYETGANVMKSSTLSLAYETYKIDSASGLYLNQAE